MRMKALQLSGACLEAFNAFDSKMSFADLDKRVEVWKALEEYAIRKKLVKKAEVLKSPGAKVNGPGLRFKTWLQDLAVPSPRLKEATIARRCARATTIIKKLDTVLDLAWRAFDDRLEKGK